MVPVDTPASTRLKNNWELRGRTWIPMYIDSDDGDKGVSETLVLSCSKNAANVPTQAVLCVEYLKV